MYNSVKSFDNEDKQNAGKLDSEEFFSALLRSKLFLSKHETSCLMGHYKSWDIYCFMCIRISILH